MNIYQKYKEQSVFSMSGAELLNLLYVEADKRLARAELALEEKMYQEFENSMVRVRDIVHYLNSVLDMSYPISRDLRRIYTYLLYDISRVKSGRERQKEEIGRIRHILSELREGFEEAANRTGENSPGRNQGILG